MRIQLILSIVFFVAVAAGITGCNDSSEPPASGNTSSTARASGDSTEASPQPTTSTEQAGTSVPEGGDAKQSPVSDPPTEESPEKSAQKPSYRIVETKSDGERLIQYEVQTPVTETRTRINAAGQEEQYTLTITVPETREALVPAGQDIDEFLKSMATRPGAPALPAEPAPVPTAP